METSKGFQYNAFITYNRAVDKRLAVSLRNALHAFNRPWYRVRALRVFLDDSSLTANPALWPSIRHALDRSEFLILLASPEAARSEWVAREIQYFLKRQSASHVLIALTDGAIEWSATRRDFDPTRTTSLPAPLYGVFSHVPRYVDLRPARRAPGMLRSPVFRELVADLAAPLHHRPKDEVFGDDLRIMRRNRATAIVAALALALTTVAATLFGIDSRSQERLAQQQRLAAVVNSLISRSESTRDTDPAVALRFGLAAFAIDPSPEARAAIVRRLVTSRYVGELPSYPGDVRDIFVTDDGRLAIVGGGEDPSEVWDIGTLSSPRRLAVLDHPKGRGWDTGPTYSIDGSPDGSIILDGNSVWDLRDPTNPVPLTFLPRLSDHYDNYTFSVSYHSARKLAIVAGGAGIDDGRKEDAALWDLADPAAPRRVGVFSGHGSPVWTAAFTNDGQYAVTGSDATEAWVWDISVPSTPRRVAELPGHPGPVWTVAMSPDNVHLITGSDAGYVALWNIQDPRTPLRVSNLAGHIGRVWTSAFSADGRQVVTGGVSDSTAILWDVSTPAQPRRVAGLTNREPVTVVAFDPRTGHVLTSDGTSTRFWHTSDSTAVDGAVGALREAIAFSEDGTIAVVNPAYEALVDRQVQVWRVADGRPVHMVGALGNATLDQLSPDGAVVFARAFGSAEPFGMWEVTDGGLVRRIEGATSIQTVNHEGTLLCAPSTDEKDDRTLWAARPELREIGRVPLSCQSFLVLPDGETLVTDTADGIRLLSSSGTILTTLPKLSLTRSFLPNAHRHMLVISGPSISAVWDIAQPTEPRLLGSVPATVVALTPDGLIGVAVDNGNTTIWDLTDPELPSQLLTVEAHRALPSPTVDKRWSLTPAASLRST